MTLDEQIRLLDSEIKWCLDNPDPAFHKEYRKGFVNGLVQAKYLLTESAMPHDKPWKDMTQ